MYHVPGQTARDGSWNRGTGTWSADGSETHSVSRGSQQEENYVANNDSSGVELTLFSIP